MSIYDHQVETLSGETVSLRQYEGDVLLIVNTASKCGFTPQLEGLEALHKKYAARGLRVLGFPSNQFAQELGSADEIGAFCQKNYGVSFPMHATVSVNGAEAHGLFKELKHAAPGFLGTEAIKWNFTKFLVDRQGRVVARFGTRTTPRELEKDIERLL